MAKARSQSSQIPFNGSLPATFKVKKEFFTLTQYNICPVCGGEGIGVYVFWATSPQYRYAHFGHSLPKGNGNGKTHRIKWHYLGKQILEDNGDGESEGSYSPEVNQTDSLAKKDVTSSPLSILASGELKPSLSPKLKPRDRYCRKCGVTYEKTYEKKCPVCNGFLVMRNHGKYS